MKDGSVLLDEYNKLADNYNRFLELSNSKDTHELRMLRSTVTSTVKRYRQTLESNRVPFLTISITSVPSRMP